MLFYEKIFIGYLFALRVPLFTFATSPTINISMQIGDTIISLRNTTQMYGVVRRYRGIGDVKHLKISSVSNDSFKLRDGTVLCATGFDTVVNGVACIEFAPKDVIWYGDMARHFLFTEELNIEILRSLNEDKKFSIKAHKLMTDILYYKTRQAMNAYTEFVGCEPTDEMIEFSRNIAEELRALVYAKGYDKITIAKQSYSALIELCNKSCG